MNVYDKAHVPYYVGTEGSNSGLLCVQAFAPRQVKESSSRYLPKQQKELLIVHRPAIYPEVHCIKLCNNLALLCRRRSVTLGHQQ